MPDGCASTSPFNLSRVASGSRRAGLSLASLSHSAADRLTSTQASPRIGMFVRADGMAAAPAVASTRRPPSAGRRPVASRAAAVRRRAETDVPPAAATPAGAPPAWAKPPKYRCRSPRLHGGGLVEPRGDESADHLLVDDRLLAHLAGLDAQALGRLGAQHHALDGAPRDRLQRDRAFFPVGFDGAGSAASAAAGASRSVVTTAASSAARPLGREGARWIAVS